MKQKSTVLRYVLLGLKIDALLICLLCLYVLIVSLYSYDGRCPDLFGASSKECSLPDFLKFNFGLLFILVVVVGWWISLLVMLVPPLLGLALGTYKSARDEETSLQPLGLSASGRIFKTNESENSSGK